MLRIIAKPGFTLKFALLRLHGDHFIPICSYARTLAAIIDGMGTQSTGTLTQSSPRTIPRAGRSPPPVPFVFCPPGLR